MSSMINLSEKPATMAAFTTVPAVISRPGSPLSEKRSRSLDIPSIILTEPAPPPSPTVPSTPKSILLLPPSTAIVSIHVATQPSRFSLRPNGPTVRGLMTVVILLAMGYHLWAQLGHAAETDPASL